MSEPHISTMIDALALKHYNAQVIALRHSGEGLVVLRVRPDRPVAPFEAGQYTTLGLGDWEPRVEGLPDAPLAAAEGKLIRRAYSVSCSMLDEQGRLSRVGAGGFLEFYISLVHGSAERPAQLTPRLFRLRVGDRLHVGPKFTGHYWLGGVQSDDDVIFAATGTGEAPHNAMVVELLARGHQGRIVSASCVRLKSDLAYLDIHRELERRHGNYRYAGLTTREPENLDPSRADYLGKHYLQDFFRSPRIAEALGHPLSAHKTHVFLCGNPQMIGLPVKTPAGRTFPQPEGMVEILERHGFVLDEPQKPGTIHYEKYW